MKLSLRASLLAWVMLPLAGAVAVDAWISHREARRTAVAVQDRLLLGSARIVAEQVHIEGDSFREHIPPAALELFEARDVDQILYRVTGSNGRLITGYAELGLPTSLLQPEVPYFFNASVRGQPVRVVAYSQPVVGAQDIEAVTVEIAQTLNGRDALTTDLWSHAILQQAVILTMTSALILLGLRQGLKPLLRLRDAVLARAPGELQPLALTDLSVELSPLVVAINDYAGRLERFAEAQRVFIQNASHQLRTPLTVITTQLSYALREDDPKAKTESLEALRDTVQQATRLVNQLLTLSTAEADEQGMLPRSVIALDAVVRRVHEDLAGHAQARNIDLGFESSADASSDVLGHPLAVREVVVNLVDNAIRYTRPGGIVTTRLQARGPQLVLTVEDNGPGIPEALRGRVFERFYRIHDGDSGGSGLGLPIVQEFVARMGARLEMRTPAGGIGLAVDVIFDTPVQPTPGEASRAV
ncbi:sensor histidine kinase [Variovorax sp. YR216]|uniref:sensor histidine kinase n=1 Tax=Variovorax sp. YR216 TaxID=1882828 RepID=UPI00089532E7|nr:sensor histidine kinase [Variovorax sp. YR216]SEB22580.1 two-component system, OmpR family, sensor histidine kinase TctE [Variovorax sp. YR216]